VPFTRSKCVYCSCNIFIKRESTFLRYHVAIHVRLTMSEAKMKEEDKKNISVESIHNLVICIYYDSRVKRRRQRRRGERWWWVAAINSPSTCGVTNCQYFHTKLALAALNKASVNISKQLAINDRLSLKVKVQMFVLVQEFILLPRPSPHICLIPANYFNNCNL
jgi:hypothetical protein